MSDKGGCPCKECIPPKRCPGCHGSCAQYIAWQKKHIRHCIAVKASKVKQKVCDDYIIPLTIKNVKRRREVEKLK